MSLQGSVSSFSPLFQKYKIEIIFVSASFFIALISFFLFLSGQNLSESKSEILITEPTVKRYNDEKLFIDIAGAVQKPGVYEVTPGARLKDALELGGGLSYGADKNFVARNFNFARFLSDQEKIYIPYSWEIYGGIFAEPQRTLAYLQPQAKPSYIPQKAQNSKVLNINTATSEELQELPGIGTITAEKIIKNRPYKSTNDLVDKKIVNKGVFEKIRSEITAY